MAYRTIRKAEIVSCPHCGQAITFAPGYAVDVTESGGKPAYKTSTGAYNNMITRHRCCPKPANRQAEFDAKSRPLLAEMITFNPLSPEWQELTERYRLLCQEYKDITNTRAGSIPTLDNDSN